MSAFDATPTQPEEEDNEENNEENFDWEMVSRSILFMPSFVLTDFFQNEFLVSLGRLDVPTYSSDVMSGEPSGGSGILPVLTFEAEPGMSVAVGNLPGQEATQVFAQEPPVHAPLDMGAFDAQLMPVLENDWINHPSLQGDFVSNEVWPGGEWFWGMGDASGLDFGGQSVDQQQPVAHVENATGPDSWYHMQGQVTDEPVGWSLDPGVQSQDNYGMEAEYLDQGQLDNGAHLEGYYTNDTVDTMPSTTYVPPTGAVFSSNRRVGGTWQLHSQS